MRKTRSWKHTRKDRKQYGNRESERQAWRDIMLAEEMYLIKMDDENSLM